MCNLKLTQYLLISVLSAKLSCYHIFKSFSRRDKSTLVMQSTMNTIVRTATIQDLPTIHDLIKDSFDDMKRFYEDGYQHSNDKWVKMAVDGDLNPLNFENTYVTKPNSNFWVITNIDTNDIYGCGALKQYCHNEAELTRMAVSPLVRGQNLGSKIINSIFDFAKIKGYQRIVLTTANADAMKFYSKHGFVVVNTFEFKMVTKSLTVFKMVKYLSEKIIQNVCIIGGTHGNERIGIQLVNEWSSVESSRSTNEGQIQILTAEKMTYKTFQTNLLLGNPVAMKLNRRYQVADLNRQFTLDDSGNIKPICSSNNAIYEQERAIEINKLLGPKLKQTDTGATWPSSHSKDVIPDKSAASMITSSSSDFIIDIHSTESDVGVLLMISGEEDSLAYRIANHIKSNEQYKDVQITCSRGNKDTSYSLDSISASGLAIEVGPIPHSHNVDEKNDLMIKTKIIIASIFDYIENHNLKLKQVIENKDMNKTTTEIETNNSSSITNSNKKKSNEELPDIYKNILVTSEKAPHLINRNHFPKLQYFKYLGKVLYPSLSEEVATTMLSNESKLNTDNNKTNTILIHPLFRYHHNLKPLRHGDIIFQQIRKSTQISSTPNDFEIVSDIPFQISETLLNQLKSDTWNPNLKNEDVTLYPLFIGEPAYAVEDGYKPAVAFYVYTLESRPIY